MPKKYGTKYFWKDNLNENSFYFKFSWNTFYVADKSFSGTMFKSWFGNKLNTYVFWNQKEWKESENEKKHHLRNLDLSFQHKHNMIKWISNWGYLNKGPL